MIRRLSHHMQICDELHDEEVTQRQNFGQHMKYEELHCRANEKSLREAMTWIEVAIEKLKQIDP